MSKTKRKTRSDKFPLTLHSTGQYCKKVKGKIYYFGKDKKQALERYLEQAAFLHNGKAKMFKTTHGNITLKSLCTIYLQHQQAEATSAEITIRHHADQISCLKKFMSFIGQHRKINEISTLDLQNYSRKLRRAYNSAHRMNLHISIMKTMFHWAKKNDILDYIPNIDAVSGVKIIYKQRHVFTPEEIRRLFDVADVQFATIQLEILSLHHLGRHMIRIPTAWGMTLMATLELSSMVNMFTLRLSITALAFTERCCVMTLQPAEVTTVGQLG